MSSGNGSSIESKKYQVIRELGRGGMGVVYLAEGWQLRRQIAHGRELWRTDATEEETVMVSDIVDTPFQSGAILPPTEHKGRLYFASNLGGLGTELWAFDDAPLRFFLVRDIVNGNAYDVLQSLVAETR